MCSAVRITDSVKDTRHSIGKIKDEPYCANWPNRMLLYPANAPCAVRCARLLLYVHRRTPAQREREERTSKLFVRAININLVELISARSRPVNFIQIMLGYLRALTIDSLAGLAILYSNVCFNSCEAIKD